MVHTMRYPMEHAKPIVVTMACIMACFMALGLGSEFGFDRVS